MLVTKLMSNYRAFWSLRVGKSNGYLSIPAAAQCESGYEVLVPLWKLFGLEIRDSLSPGMSRYGERGASEHFAIHF